MLQAVAISIRSIEIGNCNRSIPRLGGVGGKDIVRIHLIDRLSSRRIWPKLSPATDHSLCSHNAAYLKLMVTVAGELRAIRVL